jgi:hypothetical protein
LKVVLSDRPSLIRHRFKKGNFAFEQNCERQFAEIKKEELRDKKLILKFSNKNPALAGFFVWRIMILPIDVVGAEKYP